MANNYIEVGTNRTITHSFSDFNETLRTLATRFNNESNVAPTLFNFTVDTVDTEIPQGTFYSDGKNIYSYSSIFTKGTHLEADWTRNGWGPRIEENFASLRANIGAVEVGTVACTINNDSSVYLRISPAVTLQSLLNLSESQLYDGQITTAKLKDSAITTEAFGDNAINTSDIANLAIITSKFATASVTRPKFKRKAITQPKVKRDAATNIKFKPDSIGGVELAPGGVHSDSIKEKQVITDIFIDNSVTNAKIKPDEITGSRFVANTFTEREIKGLGTGAAGDILVFKSVSQGFNWGI